MPIGAALRLVNVIARDDAASDDLLAPPFDENDVARLHFVRKLPSRKRLVAIRIFDAVKRLHFVAHLLFRTEREEVAQLVPTDRHRPLRKIVFPIFRVFARRVNPVTNRRFVDKRFVGCFLRNDAAENFVAKGKRDSVCVGDFLTAAPHRVRFIPVLFKVIKNVVAGRSQRGFQSLLSEIFADICEKIER